MRLTAALALTAANERHIVDVFRTEHAVSSASSRTLRTLGLNDSPPLRQMVVALVIRRVDSDRYFLDEQAWAGRRQLQGTTIVRVLIAAATIAAVAALYFYGR
jgi:hypothetical protein